MKKRIRLVRGWLCPTKTTAEMLENLVIDKCLRILPVNKERIVGQANPVTDDHLVQCIELYLSTISLAALSRGEKTTPVVRAMDSRRVDKAKLLPSPIVKTK